jgi:hypothetical protein
MKEKKEETDKEASKLFHAIMKASVTVKKKAKGSPTKKKQEENS